MLSKDDIRNCAFGNYDEFVKYAKSKFKDLNYKGTPYEEIVNTAIISVFDVKIPFETNEDLISFIKKNMNNAAWHEKEEKKDSNYITKVSKSSGEEYSIEDKKVKCIGPSDEFIQVYLIFEKARFGENNEKKICPKCGHGNFYDINTYCKKGAFKCKGCYKVMSLTSKTHISGMKLTYIQMYNLTYYVCKYDIPSTKLSKICKLTQKTAYNRKRLVMSCIVQINSKNQFDVLNRILTLKTQEEIKDIGKRKAKFTRQDILDIRRIYDNGQVKLIDIASVYKTDPSTVSKIGRRIIYTFTE